VLEDGTKATGIFVSQDLAGGIENLSALGTVGSLTLESFARAVPAFRVLGQRTP
jgi:class 3 adenylate cyclase